MSSSGLPDEDFLFKDMTIEDCYHLGKVTKPHGIKGEVILWLDVDYPEIYEELESVFLLVKNELVPFFLESIQIRGKKSIAKFEDINSIEDTAKIINLEMYLPLDHLPELEDESSFYFHEIIGFQLQDEASGQIYGTVSHVYESAGQDLLAFEINGREVLVPISDSIVTKVDRENKILKVNLPEGLIDVYLED